MMARLLDVPDEHAKALKRPATRARDWLRRAFSEFLAVPTIVIAGMLALAVMTYVADYMQIGWLAPLRNMLEDRVFSTAEATSDLLGTVAGSIITVTSITISLLLLALQQSAASMTAQVFDQFLRRRQNQIYFGFFVGLAVFSLVTLATVGEPFNPVYGATVAFVLAVMALFLLIVLLYTTIDQMRPENIISSIQAHTLASYESLQPLVAATRRSPMLMDGATVPVHSERTGYVTWINLGPVRHAVTDSAGKMEVVLHVSIGSFVAFGDLIAEVKAQSSGEAATLADMVDEIIRLEQNRDISRDPAFGIEELEMIAWTSISTSKSNPAPGIFTIQSLRDLLSRWSVAPPPDKVDEPVPVVYRDPTFDRLLDTFESLGVVSTESMQHQSLAEVLAAFTATVERLSPERRARVEDLVLRLLSGLGDHVLTRILEVELERLAAVLRRCRAGDTASAVDAARLLLRRSVGTLNSRATRVPEEASS